MLPTALPLPMLLPLQFPIGDHGELPSLTTVAPAAAAAAERAVGPTDDDADKIGFSTMLIRRQGGEGKWTTKKGGRCLITEAAAASAALGDAWTANSTGSSDIS
jgi:hypothetical protein